MEKTNNVKKYLLYTLPFIIEYIFLQLTDFADTTLSAHVNESTIVGVSTMMLIVVVIITFSKVMASTNEILISRIYGKKHKENSVNTVTYNSLVLAVLINILACIIVFIFTNKIIDLMGLTGKAYLISKLYLRIRLIGCLSIPFSTIIESKLKVIDKHKEVTTTKVTYTILNIFGNTLAVIFGFGALGIAISTVISEFVELIMFLIYNRGIQIRSIKKHIIKDLMKIYKIIIFSKLGTRIGIVIFTSLVSNLEQTIYANYVIAVQIIYLGTSMSEALGESNLIQIGQLIGEKDNEKIIELQNIAKKSSYIIALIQLFVFVVFAKPLLILVSNNTYNEIAVVILYMLILEMIIETLYYPLEGYLLAFKEVRYTTKVTLQGILLIRIVLGIIFLKINLNVYGIVLALILDYFIRYIRCYLYIRKHQERRMIE